MINCPVCNSEYNEYPERKEKYRKKYCSRKCAAAFNNKFFPKKVAKATINCIDCNNILLKKSQKGRRLCNECRIKRSDNYLYKQNPTRKDVVYDQLTRSAAFAYIRWHAKSIVMKNIEKKCAKCGYSNHVEACHIKPIAAFNDNDRLETINNIENLIYLCPNHHWEHDFMKVVGQEGNAPSSID